MNKGEILKMFLLIESPVQLVIKKKKKMNLDPISYHTQNINTRSSVDRCTCKRGRGDFQEVTDTYILMTEQPTIY